MRLTDDRLRVACHERAEAVVDAILAKPDFRNYDPRKCCLLWAFAVLEAGKSVGRGLEHLQLQGGSASWRIVPDHLDDGRSPTHYSYVYTPDPVVMSRDGLGECHYWCAVHPKHDPAGKGLVVDFTTKHIPSLVEDIGMKVLCSTPDWVWHRPDRLPEGADKYAPDEGATLSGLMILQSVFGVTRIRRNK